MPDFAACAIGNLDPEKTLLDHERDRVGFMFRCAGIIISYFRQQSKLLRETVGAMYGAVSNSSKLVFDGWAVIHG